MKPRILLTVNHYLPGYLAGGTTKAAAGLVESLGDEFEILVVTSDRDFKAPSPYPRVQLDVWSSVGKAQVYYMRKRSQTISGIARLLRQTPHDLLYLNSYFSPRFSIIPLIVMRVGLVPVRPVLIAPRGEFSAGAYNLKKWKKWPFASISRILGLHRRVHWHASTDLDAADIRRVMRVPDAQVIVASEVVAPVRATGGTATKTRLNDGSLHMCFLSRISRKKNLDFALRVLTRVRASIVFDIYGPKEDLDYWHECEILIAKLPADVRVNYMGPVPSPDVLDIIARYDVFFVPTRGENFGYVFLEALSAGVPVLTSDQTPWRDLQRAGVGWDISLQVPGRFAAVLDEASDWSADMRAGYRRRCVEFAESYVRCQGGVEAHRRMFDQVLGTTVSGRR